MELRRAKDQILKCKLGIRDVVHQLDLLNPTTIGCNGSVSCLKCQSLRKELLCQRCESKTRVLDALNAYLGTNFAPSDTWEAVFREATAGGGDSEDQASKWLSDESDDESYCPEESEMSSSEESSSGSDLSEPAMGSSCRRRQRNVVDYKQLHDEMFGKESDEEDEDWDPHNRRKTLLGAVDPCAVEEDGYSSGQGKQVRRIPADAVKEFRREFAGNELPPRAVKEELSRRTGVPYQQVNVWFRNARYVAVKGRKASAVVEADESYFRPLAEIINIPKKLCCRKGTTADFRKAGLG